MQDKKAFRNHNFLTIWIILITVLFQAYEVYAQPAQPTGLTAFHRSGQTFLTWNEKYFNFK